MANLKAIRKRIVTVKNTRQITKAMKMVAAAKLRRAQESLMSGRPYAQHLLETIKRLAGQSDEALHPLFRTSERSKTLLVIVTSDRGLCGGFNANLNRAAEQFLKQHIDSLDSVDLAFIGRKGRDYFRYRGARYNTNTAHYFEDVFTDLNIERAREISETLIQDFTTEKYDQIYTIYNEFKSAVSQNVIIEKLLPIAPDFTQEEEPTREYIYEPAQAQLLARLLPLHVNAFIFRALRESFAAEMGARMAAMDSATNNATDMIAQLTLDFNRARQAAITTELIEIISGAEAL